MAPPAGTLRVGRYFLALVGLLAILYALVFLPGHRHTPKLGIDLAGGQQVIFTAELPHGKTPSKSSMQQAQQIIEDRVNGSGVTESTVVIQGNNQIVVSIPGATNADVQALGNAAVLNFRPLVAPPVPVTCTPTTSGSGAAAASSGGSAAPTAGSSGASGKPPTSSTKSAASTKAAASAKGAEQHRLPAAAAASPAPSSGSAPANGSGQATVSGGSATPGSAKASGSKAAGSGTPSAPVSGSGASSPAAAQPCSANPLAAVAKQITGGMPTSETVYAQLAQQQQQAIQTALANFDCNSASTEADEANTYFLACDSSGQAYYLGSIIVPGREISSASAQAPNLGTPGGSANWTVALSLKSSGQTAWSKYTAAHNINDPTGTASVSSSTCSSSSTPCADFVAFTLDGQVISAPVNSTAINGTTQISGGFTQSSAKTLARQLKYGALPVNFKLDSNETVSATLGTSQLKAGLLAGGIGLILVVIYSLIYYRALGLVTISSLIVSGLLTYAALVILGEHIGFTLSLAGIAGFIVAVGITADSFVVFFERIKDEVHEGRSFRVAIPRAWIRARRTILSADTVSFLAAAILYYFAAGDVKGFAFTLGLSTILDLIVVFLFTHPLISLLSRGRAFGSARFTGLNAVRGGIAAADEAPAPHARRSTAARRVEAAGAEAESAERFGGVAVIDKRESRAEAERRRTAERAREEELEDESYEDDETYEDETYEDETYEDETYEDDEAESDAAEDEEAQEHEADSDDAEATGDEDDEPVADAEIDDEPEDEDSPAEDESEPEEEADAERPRRRTTPATGSAAERAAARRARLREQRRGEKGGS